MTRMKHLPVIFHFYLLLHVILLFTSTSESKHVSGIEWIVASYRESHAEACQRRKLHVTEPFLESISWNTTVFHDIVTRQLGYNVSNLFVSNGVEGCCAPSLWCDTTTRTCFTQGFSSSYINYGWLDNDNTSRPVYTCVDKDNTTTSNNQVVLLQVLGVGKTVELTGQNFGATEEDVSVAINGEDCSALELCNAQICSICSSTIQCSMSSICLSFRAIQNTPSYCFMTCASSDSCPCNTFCQAVRVAQSEEPINVCVPTTLDGRQDVCANYFPHPYTYAQCQNPRRNQKQLQVTFDNHINASVAVNNDVATLTRSATTSDYKWCKFNSDCTDGNICTNHYCDDGYCRYETVKGCQSTIPTLRARNTPYTYYSFSFTNLSIQHRHFVSSIEKLGGVSHTSQQYKYPGDVEPLPFWINYFGNKVNTVRISASGVISLPPFRVCDGIQCILFSSSANVIAPWHSDWNPSKFYPTTKIYKFNQRRNDGTKLLGIDANAFHVLYRNMKHIRPTSSPTSSGGGSIDDLPDSYYNAKNTFSASIYEDGSIALNYIDIPPTSFLAYPDFAGLWGAFPFDYQRYHVENVTSQFIRNNRSDNSLNTNSKVAYCAIATIGCITEACVQAGNANNNLTVNWDGPSSCLAIAPHELAFECHWIGGAAVTAAVLTTAPADGTKRVLACSVPELDLPDGTVTYVDIRVFYQFYSGSSVDPTVVPTPELDRLENDKPGKKSVYQLSNELAEARFYVKSNLQVRYYNRTSTNRPIRCGCSALSAYGGRSCDHNNICGVTTSAVTDCNGVVYGSAYVDSCGICAAGSTGRTPNECGGGSPRDVLNLITQTIIVLMVICCMTLLTSSISYTIRRVLASRAINAQLDNEFGLTFVDLNGFTTTTANTRGLTPFECEALGQVVFSKEVYNDFKQKMSRGNQNTNAEHTDHNAADGEANKPSAAEGAVLKDDSDVIDFNAAEYHNEESKISSSANNNNNNTTITTSYTDLESNNNNATGYDCPICLVEVVEGNICRILPEPCNHLFHLNCIDEWFRQSFVCPLCKRSMRAILEGTEGDMPLTLNNTNQAARGVGVGVDGNRSDRPDDLIQRGTLRFTNIGRSSANNATGSSGSSRSNQGPGPTISVNTVNTDHEQRGQSMSSDASVASNSTDTSIYPAPHAGPHRLLLLPAYPTASSTNHTINVRGSSNDTGLQPRQLNNYISYFTNTNNLPGIHRTNSHNSINSISDLRQLHQPYTRPSTNPSTYGFSEVGSSHNSNSRASSVNNEYGYGSNSVTNSNSSLHNNVELEMVGEETALTASSNNIPYRSTLALDSEPVTLGHASVPHSHTVRHTVTDNNYLSEDAVPLNSTVLTDNSEEWSPIPHSNSRFSISPGRRGVSNHHNTNTNSTRNNNLDYFAVDRASRDSKDSTDYL